MSFAIVDGVPIFLDVQRDRYFALDGRAARAFHIFSQDPAALDDRRELADALLGTGLFEWSDAVWRPLPIDFAAPENQLATTQERLRPLELIEIALLVGRARRALRTGRLQAVLGRCRKGGRQDMSPDQVLRSAQRFAAGRGWVPIAPSCLQDSLALRWWLDRRSSSAALVIGVKLDPFAAHAWVQLDSMVLNDAVDRVAPFTPIRVIA